jgi:hypothetical protein
MTESNRNITGEIVSRLAMALVAIALIYGGTKSLRAAYVTAAAFYQSHPHIHHE